VHKVLLFLLANNALLDIGAQIVHNVLAILLMEVVLI